MTGLFDMACIGLLLQRREQNRRAGLAPVGLDAQDLRSARERVRRPRS
ncbi:MAG TPA: hypothetical protein VHA07_10080 [Devosia sp.]|nr:hypothetical protein [Devosia sp.]